MDLGLLRSLRRWRDRAGLQALIDDQVLADLARYEPTHVEHLDGLGLSEDVRSRLGQELVATVRRHLLGELYVELGLH